MFYALIIGGAYDVVCQWGYCDHFVMMHACTCVWVCMWSVGQ